MCSKRFRVTFCKFSQVCMETRRHSYFYVRKLMLTVCSTLCVLKGRSHDNRVGGSLSVRAAIFKVFRNKTKGSTKTLEHISNLYF